jgi:hypothetical protein
MIYRVMKLNEPREADVMELEVEIGLIGPFMKTIVDALNKAVQIKADKYNKRNRQPVEQPMAPSAPSDAAALAAAAAAAVEQANTAAKRLAHYKKAKAKSSGVPKVHAMTHYADSLRE